MPAIVLLGHPVRHSRSPTFQNAALAAIGSPWRYGVRDVDADGVVDAIDEIRRGQLVGANVTAPHKRVAFEHADDATPTAMALGVANTLWREDGCVRADNTDVVGIEAMAASAGVEWAGHVVVIGAGGAARAAVLALGARSGRISIANRTSARATALVDALAPHVDAPLDVVAADPESMPDAVDLIVQATSVRDADPSRWGAWFDAAPGASAALDLVYDSEPTGFVAAARQRGVVAVDGAVMLVEQGAASFARWTGETAPRDAMYRALGEALGRPLVPTIHAPPGRRPL